MLRGIHKASANWLGRAVMGVILGLIAISFGVWGIGDIFRGFGLSTVAKVGRTEIGIEQYRQVYNDRLQDLGRRTGRPVTPDQVRMFGIDRQVLNQMIQEILLDERARSLGLGMSETELAKRITDNPSFRGFNGQFDHNLFLRAIRQAGYGTEQKFMAEQRREMLRQQLLSAVTGEILPPKSSLEAINRYQNEQRTIEYVMLNRATAGDIPAPTPEVINKFYEDRKVQFRAPEYRKFVFLAVSPEELIPTIEVSDADIKAAYEKFQSRYVKPERRRVQQIMFKTAEEAQKAYGRLTGGMQFSALAAEPGIKETYSDLGTVTKTEVIDPAVGEAAFALKTGGIAGPVQGNFGVAVVYVDKIEQGQSTPLEQVSADLKREVGLERAAREVQNMHDKITDERLEGKTLEQIAEKFSLKVRTVEAIDRSGRDPNGTQVPDLPQASDLINAAFLTDVNAENEPLNIQGGGFVWYDLKGVTPSRDRPLDEIKAQVETRWRDDEVAAKLKTKTAELLDKLKSGAPMAEVATANKLKAETKTGLKRGTALSGIPLRALNEIFRTAKGSAGVTDGESATDRIIYRVTDIVVPTLDTESPDAKRYDQVLRRAIADDLRDQFLARLQTDIGISINQAALNQVTGVGKN